MVYQAGFLFTSSFPNLANLSSNQQLAEPSSTNICGSQWDLEPRIPWVYRSYHTWLVVEPPTPTWKMMEWKSVGMMKFPIRQLGWWHSQLNGKSSKSMVPVTTNQIRPMGWLKQPLFSGHCQNVIQMKCSFGACYRLLMSKNTFAQLSHPLN